MIINIELLKIYWLVILAILIIFTFLRFYLAMWWKKEGAVKYNLENKKITVIVPCKGVDLEFERNIKSLINQSFKGFHIVSVVDSMDDPAVEILRNNQLEVICSDRKFKGSGKVAAISTAIEKYSQSDIFILLDSDTYVDNTWLKNLVSPLGDGSVGAVSTYPFYDPVGKGNLWDYIKKTWGYLGINMMEFKPTRFVWGGSVAFRKDLIFPENFQRFSQSVSDDSQITLFCKEKGLDIAYAHKTRPIVYVNETRSSFMEWSNRQVAISISHSKKALYAGITIYGLMIAYLIALIPLSIFVWDIFLLGYLPWLLNILFNISREKKGISMIFLASVLLSFIYFIYMVKGSRSNHIIWRGKKYKVKNDKV